MPEIIDESTFASLETECLARLDGKVSAELQRSLDNDPPLRHHVRAVAPRRDRLEELKQLWTAGGIFPADLEPRRWLAPLIDHTLLRADASHAELENHCREAREAGVGAVCVNPRFVAACKTWLAGSKTGVVTVVGFPLGANQTEVKVAEAKRAIADGALELDMVLAIGELKSARYDAVWEDIRAVTQAAGTHPVKVILETSALGDAEKVIAAWLARAGGAHYLKTSTGMPAKAGAYGVSGATPRDVALLRLAGGQAVGIKASGGVKNLADAINMILAGADRIGAGATKHILEGKAA